MNHIFEITNENQLAHIYEPEPGLFIAESPLVIERALDAGYIAESFLVETESKNEKTKEILKRCPAAEVIEKTKEELKFYRGYEQTRGLIAAMKRKEKVDLSIPDEYTRVVILEDVENPTNVGAIFRSAAALNIDAIYLTKGCADPLYRRAARVSMGNVFNIPWAYVDDIDEIKNAGFKTAALALSDNTISISDAILKNEKKLALILGNEGNGLKQETIDKSDYAVKIPMKEGIDSLNVSVAAGIAMWEIRN